MSKLKDIEEHFNITLSEMHLSTKSEKYYLVFSDVEIHSISALQETLAKELDEIVFAQEIVELHQSGRICKIAFGVYPDFYSEEERHKINIEKENKIGKIEESIEDCCAIYCDDRCYISHVDKNEFYVDIPLVDYDQNNFPYMKVIKDLQKIGVKSFNTFDFEIFEISEDEKEESLAFFVKF